MLESLLLTRSDVRQVANWPAFFLAVRQALLLRQAGKAAAPISGQIIMPGALLHLKAGAIFDSGVLSVKANMRPLNGEVSGVVVLFDPESGKLSAILDSADITAMRTAALATVAAEVLASPGAVDLAILGAGPVARRVLESLPHRLPVRRVHLWSRSRQRAELLAKTSTLPVSIHDTPGDAARHANVIVTVTPSRSPFLEAKDISEGALVLALGADSLGKRELGSSILEAAIIIADQREDVVKVGESAYLATENTNYVIRELGELLATPELLPIRTEMKSRFIVFDSVGSATLDAAVSASIVTEARLRGLGKAFDFSS